MPLKKTSKVEKELLENTVTSVSLPVPAKRSQLIASKQQAKNLAESLSDTELGNILAKVATVRAWASAVEAEALNRIAHDKKIPGFKLVEGRSNRAWKNEDKLKKRMFKLGFILDEIAPRELLSPAGIETLLKKAKRSSEWGIIAPLVTRPPGKFAIAPVTDPRPEITRGSEFGDDIHD